MKKGSKMTDESKLKISLSKKGHKMTLEQRERMSRAKMGHRPWSRGRKASPKEIEKNRLSHLGKKHSIDTRKKISEALTGKNFGRIGSNHPRWIEDRTKIKHYWTERNNPEYKQWRMAVWLRDNFKCKIANPDCKGRLEAHHILSWREFSELRYEINNGITLCHAHHPKVRAEEKRLQEAFQQLVMTASKV